MKRNQFKRWATCAALAAAGLMAGSAQADTVSVSVNVAGIASNGQFGDASNEVQTIMTRAGAHIIGIGWDVSLSTVASSWLSEISVDVSSASNSLAGFSLAPGFADSSAGSGTYNSPLIDLIDAGLDFFVGADGMLRLEFFDSFDDYAGADAFWRQGSLTIQYAVPEPASVALAGLALAGALGASRRRKAAAPAA